MVQNKSIGTDIDSFPRHRISLEPRSGIWLMFYETLISSLRRQAKNSYKQELVEVFNDFDIAKQVALVEINNRRVECELIVRNNRQRYEILRRA